MESKIILQTTPRFWKIFTLQAFQQKFFTYFSVLMRATRPSNLILVDLIILIITG